jgi:hypothetical protein
VDFITLGNTSLRMNINRTYLLLFLSLSFVLLTSALNGQYYVINDKDGFVNIRTKPAADGKIICQLNNGRVVREIGIEDSLYKNWVHIEFYIPKKEAGQVKRKPESEEESPAPKVMADHLLFTGYVYKDRLLNIEQQQRLKTDNSGDFYKLYNDSIIINFNDRSFEKQKHKIEIKEGSSEVKIDGHYIIGTDGTIPEYEFKTFSVEIDHQIVGIPKTSYYDLYHPNLNRFTNAYVYNGTLYIIMRNSDGAGVYEVIFIIKNKKYIDRYVFDGEC